MNSRAASAATSRKVRQTLVRLLFGGSGKESSSSAAYRTCDEIVHRAKTLDNSTYSYGELRSKYLEKLQELHPDKSYHQQQQQQQQASKATSTDRIWDDHEDVAVPETAASTDHSDFVELQEAWDAYEKLVKLSKTVDTDGSIEKDRNFTLFGVGCSFSDSEAERQLRMEITDQACRGWFSSGSLTTTATASSASSTSTTANQTNHNMPPLLDEDDDMFVTVKNGTTTDEEAANNSSTSTSSSTTIQNQQQSPRRRPSLVDKKFRPKSSAG